MDRILLRLLLCTGLRPSELFALRWCSFDVEKKLLHITESVYRGKLREYTKTTGANSRQELQVVFLPDIIVIDLQAWRTVQADWHNGDDDFIFSNSVNGDTIWKENYQHRHLNPLACKAFHDGSCAKVGIRCKGQNVPKVNFQILRRSVATHTQGIGSAKDTQTILRHAKPSTAQEHYVQSMEESVRTTIDKLATLPLN
jgi:integrase